MLILQQPHQLSYQPVPFVSRARKVINLIVKKDFNFAITTPMATRTPRAILLTTWKHNENFPVLFWALIWNFKYRKVLPNFWKDRVGIKVIHFKRKQTHLTNVVLIVFGSFCLRGSLISSVKKDSSFSCPLIRIDRTGEGGINEGQRKDDLKLANVSTYWSMKFSKSRK